MPIPPHKIIQLRITLAHIEPPIWRRVQVPADLTLRRLHDVIQAAFGWLDYHLHEFRIDDKLYGQSEVEGVDAPGHPLHSDRYIRLRTLVDRGAERFVYTYDFGDDWEHLITVEEIMEPAAGVEYPVFVDGARAAPPEDCGGPPGFEDFLDAMANAQHPAHDDLREWYGGPFDPEDLQREAMEARLQRIRAGRRKGPAKGTISPRRGGWIKS
jgi:hypothetical protein